MGSLRRLAVAALLAVAVPWPTAQAAETVRVKAEADATVSAGAPAGRFGRERALVLTSRPAAHALVRFRVRTPSRLLGARLELFAYSSRGGGVVTIRRAGGSWREHSVAYRNAPRVRARPRVSRRVPPRGGWIRVDVGRLVRRGTVTLAVSTSSRDAVVFASRENRARAPRLALRVESPPAAGSVTLAAAGNIACDPRSPSFNGGAGSASDCGMKSTSDLLLGMSPDAVLALGDNQYPCADYNDFLTSFHPTWGRLLHLIRPIQGNHDFECDFSGRARGYFQYFGAQAGEPGKGYYSFDLGAWHVIALNSQCNHVGGCGPESPQGQWLRADLAAHPNRCVLAYWHYPRFASGISGSRTEGAPLWDMLYEANADVVLSAHEHHYERFLPQNPRGQVDMQRGITQFVVGTGGRELHGFNVLAPNSRIRLNTSWGVLKLTLRATSYTWQFVPVGGRPIGDAGTASCH